MCPRMKKKREKKRLFRAQLRVFVDAFSIFVNQINCVVKSVLYLSRDTHNDLFS